MFKPGGRNVSKFLIYFFDKSLKVTKFALHPDPKQRIKQLIRPVLSLVANHFTQIAAALICVGGESANGTRKLPIDRLLGPGLTNSYLIG
jgi:hypothetical protein